MNMWAGTAATVNLDQYSPALNFVGYGWKTAATAGSWAMSIAQYCAPEQGTAAPTGVFKWSYGTGNTSPTEANEIGRFEWGERAQVVWNEQGLDRDHRIEGDTKANLFTLDAGLDMIGIDLATPASRLDVGASFGAKVTARSADTTLDATHYHVEVTTGSVADVTITLPAAVNCLGRIYKITKVDAGTKNVIVDGNAAETINGAATKTSSARWDSITIQSNGTSWTKTSRIGTWS
jgi:hypothetical protein